MVSGALSEALNWYSSSKIASLMIRRSSRNLLEELVGLPGNSELGTGKGIQFSLLEILLRCNPGGRQFRTPER